MAKVLVKFVNAKDYPDNPDAQAAIWVNDALKYYGITWNKLGEIQVKVGDDVLLAKPNHVKSIIRRDFIQAKGNLPGLSQIIEDVFAFKRYRAIGLGDKREQLETTGILTS
jgi:hypothetical protein